MKKIKSVTFLVGNEEKIYLIEKEPGIWSYGIFCQKSHGASFVFSEEFILKVHPEWFEVKFKKEKSCS